MDRYLDKQQGSPRGGVGSMGKEAGSRDRREGQESRRAGKVRQGRDTPQGTSKTNIL